MKTEKIQLVIQGIMSFMILGLYFALIIIGTVYSLNYPDRDIWVVIQPYINILGPLAGLVAGIYLKKQAEPMLK